jgi:hypothetical protein
VPDEPAKDYPRGTLLPDDAVLVRGGPLDSDQLDAAARQPFEGGHDFYGISMWSFPDERDPEAIFERTPLQYPIICMASAREIREAGFEVKRTFKKRGHCSLILLGEPSGEDIDTLMRLLEPCWTIGGEQDASVD